LQNSRKLDVHEKLVFYSTTPDVYHLTRYKMNTIQMNTPNDTYFLLWHRRELSAVSVYALQREQDETEVHGPSAVWSDLSLSTVWWSPAQKTQTTQTKYQLCGRNYREWVRVFNTFAATAELSRQFMCIGKCHWRVYSSFSTCNSAIHRHHSR